MMRVISLIACFSIAVFAQNEQEQQSPPPPQQAYPPEQQVQPQQQQYPQQQYPPQQYQQYPPQQYPPQQYQQYPPQQYPPQQAYPPQQQEQNKNFSAGQRWGTWGLNLVVPGLGSYIFMKDIAGGIIQDVLWIGGFVLMQVGVDEYEEYGEQVVDILPIYYVGLGAFGVSFIFNIIRSATYDKPGSVAYRNKNEGFNFAVLPNRRGEFMPYVLYSKAF